MIKNSKKSKIDKYGLCLNEYENNFNNAKVYYDRATGKKPEMEVSKAMANQLKNIIVKNDHILDVGCACGHYYRSIKKELIRIFITQEQIHIKSFLIKLILLGKMIKIQILSKVIFTNCLSKKSI